MFKRPGERLSMIITDVEDIKEIQLGLLEIKKHVRCNNISLDIVEDGWTGEQIEIV